MAYFNPWTSGDALRRVSTGALYYNGTAAMGAAGRPYTDISGLGGPDTGMTFAQIMGQSAARSRGADSSELSSSLDGIFEEASDRYQVDVNLLRAIGKAESGFNPSAVSQAGAQGVMQLMPGTADSLGVSDPFDARQNIMGGASYIAGLLKQYNGDAGLALAAYNAGSGNVEKYGGIPPFPETQAYVERVLGYAGQEVTAGQVQGQSGYGGQTDRSRDNRLQADSGIQMGAAEYWSHMVDRMRVQMDMRLAGILSSEDGEDGSRGIGI